MKLIVKLFIGMLVGVGIGLLGVDFLTRLAVTVKLLFGQFLGFVIPFIILFFITSGVASLGKSQGKMVGVTVGTAYVSTLLAGTLAFFVAKFIMPMVATESTAITEGATFQPFIEIEILPLMGVITAVAMAFLFGIGIAKTKSATMKSFFDEGKEIIERCIMKILIPFLPIYIAGIFAELTAAGKVYETLSIFGLVLLVVVATHWLWLCVQFTTAGFIAGQSPLRTLKTMLPAYFTGVGTMSSAATIPVTLNQVKKNRVKEEVADFAVPLCATIHLSGSMITIVITSMAVMTVLSDLSVPSFGAMLSVIVMLGVVMIAAPGVPGGAIVAALGVLTSMLGFSEAAIGLMMALYMAQDSFGTATNVTGDGAITMIVDKVNK
ncbi:dicarboxylate/amino acid:cation symporter [Shouchella lonarensis]|uniref:Na+/H+-dicarboxylate symporter n=1 Tax=Shouchella lonarensis TaxID=1464122 RepID=A0A1G6HJM9_9BACI|nr:dicarboxylate/amino acid:cation symporter [Shouchella lonarensis]SDB94308.1 Na+/H+-dicarboxylate symporter [Shouchella lonarensis]